MYNLPPAAGRAMVKQAKRLHREPTPQEIIDELRAALTKAQNELKAANAEIDRLNKEADDLALKAFTASKGKDGKKLSGQFHDGIAYVNQNQAAAILRVDQAQISRWVKANKFTVIQVPNRKRPQIVLSSLKRPEPEKRGRKKK